MIEIQNEFRVPADAGAVYEYLLQLEQVGACIPGGKVGPAGEDGAHPAEIVLKLGPMRFTYRGTVRLEERAEASRTARMAADLRDARGQGSATARMEMRVEAEDNGARVHTRTEVQLTGRAASMGRGVIDDVAARLVDDMAACVTERVGARAEDTAAAAPACAEPAPVSGVRLMARVLLARVKRLFKRR